MENSGVTVFVRMSSQMMLLETGLKQHDDKRTDRQTNKPPRPFVYRNLDHLVSGNEATEKRYEFNPRQVQCVPLSWLQ